MKKSNLKMTGEIYSLTPDSWGSVNSIIIDEKPITIIMANLFDMTIEAVTHDIEHSDSIEIAVDAQGNYYAIKNGQYAPCDNPINVSQGCADLYDAWEFFDEEESNE